MKIFTRTALVFLVIAGVVMGAPSYATVETQSVKTIKVIPTITSGSAYSTGQQVGGIETLTDAAMLSSGGAFVQDVAVTDMSKQSQAIDIYVFDSLPTVQSVDHGTFNLTSANFAKCVGVISVATTDYKITSAQSAANVGLVNKVYTPAPNPSGQGYSRTLYAIPVIRGAATYTDTHALQFIYKFFQY